MDYLDLTSLLGAYRGTLKNVEVYGKIVSRLPKPSNLFDNVKFSDTGMFVRMEVFAVNLAYHKQYLKQCGLEAPNDIYMVNGSIVTFVEKGNKKFPDWYTVCGTLRFASKSTNNYVSLFDFRKNGNDWYINASSLSNIEISDWDRYSNTYYWINMCKGEDNVVRPDVVSNLPKFYATDITLEMSVKTPSNPVSLNESLKEYTNGVSVPSISSSNRLMFNKESRQDIKDFSDLYEKFEVCLKDSKSSREKFIRELNNTYYEQEGCTGYIKYTINGLRNNLRRKPTRCAMTGRMILSKYLSLYGKISTKKYAGTTTLDYLIKMFDEVSMYIEYGRDVEVDGVAWDLCLSAFSEPEKFYAGIISVILGVSSDILFDIQSKCSRLHISFSKLLNENPYALQLFGGLSFSDIEHIALCFGKANDKSLDKYRNICTLNSFIDDKSNGSTVFKESQLKSSKLGISLTKTQFNAYKSRGTHLTDIVCDNVLYYLHSYNEKLGYDVKRGWVANGYYMVKQLSPNIVSNIIKDYVESGLGVSYNGYVTSYSMLTKELFVYKTMHNLGSQCNNFDSELIDKYIDEYEEIVGYKLEEMQRKAVHLVEHNGAVIAGGAGSGKTTVSNCIVYVLNKLDPNAEIKFAAPTGKAAKRMQEVVKQPVKTMCSMFRVMNSDSNNLFEDNDDNEVALVGESYFFDEGAMVTLDLLYSILKRVSRCRIYLFGDFNQLPPIGKGVPFKNLLRFMPCVFLNVSKRAVEGSGITLNSDYINEYSEFNNWKELKSCKDFFLVPCSEDNLKNFTVDICRNYLGKLTPDESKNLAKNLGIDTLPVIDDLTEDDIQVVSPVGKSTYTWGTNAMNKLLQPLFNKTRGFNNTILYQPSVDSPYTKLTIGDRVIHNSVNMYSMQWYKSVEGGVFEKAWGHGVCNGDVGKIVGFYPADSCEFIDEDEDTRPDDFKYPDNLRDDSTYDGEDFWFVVVKYFDYMSSEDYYILYRCVENVDSSSNLGKSFKGTDLSLLSLFYAGTTHKLQGSQAKLIIALLGNVNYTGFITRNMVYTMFTRGEKLVFALGSVGNERNSQLSRARRDVADKDVDTIGELLHP